MEFSKFKKVNAENRSLFYGCITFFSNNFNMQKVTIQIENYGIEVCV